MIIQKYIVDIGTKKNRDNKLPWFLSGDNLQSEEDPDYVISCGNNSVPGNLYVTRFFFPKNVFSVFLGFTNLPFINFDQVVIPKYEANVKMAKLGPLARQNNCIVTDTPLTDNTLLPMSHKSNSLVNNITNNFKEKNNEITVIVIGGHSSQCRWYTENAIQLVDNMKKIVTQTNTNLLVIFTEKTSELIKKTMKTNIEKHIANHHTRVVTWDSTQDGLHNLEKIETYDNLIEKSSRVILTADLEYANIHAAMKKKPIYIAFGGYCTGHLVHFHRWLRDQRLTRKLRLDRKTSSPLIASTSKENKDTFSYLGHHPPFSIASKVLQSHSILSHVKNEIETTRDEKLTGKRRKN
ncbi:unnamed protein product [Cunninghamella blakesleeana]